MATRPLKRALIMLDYGSEDPHSGEVFDLAELVAEMSPKTEYGAHIDVRIESNVDYDKDRVNGRHPWKLSVAFGGHALGGGYLSGATHLDDVVNAVLPDGFKVQDLRKKAARVRKKAEQLDHDIMLARLEQAASIRHTNPIGRVTETPKMLEGAP